MEERKRGKEKKMNFLLRNTYSYAYLSIFEFYCFDRFSVFVPNRKRMENEKTKETQIADQVLAIMLKCVHHFDAVGLSSVRLQMYWKKQREISEKGAVRKCVSILAMQTFVQKQILLNIYFSALKFNDIFHPFLLVCRYFSRSVLHA